MIIYRREITKEEYDKLNEFYKEFNNLPQPKKVYDKDGNVYYEIPEWK